MSDDLTPGEIGRSLHRLEKSLEVMRHQLDDLQRLPTWTAVNDRLDIERAAREKDIESVAADVATIEANLRWVVVTVIGAVLVSVMEFFLR